MRPTILALAVALATAIAAPQSQAAPVLLIDTLNATPTSPAVRPDRLTPAVGPTIEGTGVGSLIDFSPSNPASTWIVDSIEVNVRIDQPGQLRFVIFNHPTHTLIGQSNPIDFAADASSDVANLWKASGRIFAIDPVLGQVNAPVVLTDGQYDIGAIYSTPGGNGVGRWTTDTSGATGNVDGFSSITSMPEFEEIDTPRLSILGAHTNGFDGAFRLYAVPEPSSLALCGVGLIGMAGSAIRRRRTKKAAAAIPAI